MSLVKPTYLLFYSFLIWFIAFVTIPAKYINLGDSLFYPLATLFVYNILFVIGSASIKSVQRKDHYISPQKKKQIILIFFLIGFIGVIIRIYQRVYLQEIYFAEDLVRTRMDLMATEGNSGLLGVISALTYPFSTIALMLSIIWNKNINRFFLIPLLIFGLYPIIDSFLTESRLLIVFVACMLFITILASKISFFKSFTQFKLKGIRLIKLPTIFRKKRFYFPIIILFVGFIVFSKNVINNRLATFGYRDTLSVWEFYHDTEIEEGFKKEVRNANSVEEKNKLIGTYSLKHYFCHSVFEYIRLVNHLDSTTGYYYGVYEYYTFIKPFKILGIPIASFSDLNKVSLKPAVYTTFWGPFYIDFGIFGFLISFLLGRFSKRMYLKAKNGSESAILLYSFIAVIILASFFVNFSMGGNLYFLFAIFVGILFIKFWPNNIVITK